MSKKAIIGEIPKINIYYSKGKFNVWYKDFLELGSYDSNINNLILNENSKFDKNITKEEIKNQLNLLKSQINLFLSNL